ncbi:MAG: N-6 DNA methylase, partial [Clostridia bacterium]|nr:N-6 DNA methylase [Clostridia bacterium]
LRMTQIANIADNMTESQKNAWKLLISKCEMDSETIDSCLRTAALLYLFKKNALAFKFDSEVPVDKVFFKINANTISEKDYEQLGQQKQKEYKTLNFFSILTDEDPLCKVVKNSLEGLSRHGLSLNARPLIIDIVSGKKNISEASYFFDSVIKRGRYGAEMLVFPSELYELASMLIEFKDRTVLNLFQNGFISFAKTISGYATFTGIGINSPACDFISLYLSLLDKELPLKYVGVDELVEFEDGKYDVIISNPSFYRAVINGKAIDLTTFAMERFNSLTNDEGVLLTFVPTGVLSGLVKIKCIRQNLIENNFLDAVILLPQRLLYGTSIPLALLVLKKGRAAGKNIRMVDASSMSIKSNSSLADRLDVKSVYDAYLNDGATSVSVSTEEIAGNLFSLDVPLYTHTRDEIKGSKFRKGFDIKTLSEILVAIPVNKKFDERVGRIVRVKDIPSDWTDNKIDIGKLKLNDDLRNTRKLTQSALLLNTIGDKIKIAWCDATTEQPVFLGSNVNAYSFKYENISIDYLAMEVSKRYIPGSGTFVSHISQETLSLVRIDFPPFDRSDCKDLQNNLFNEAKSAFLMGKAEEMGLQKEIDRMKSQYIDEIRVRKHNIAQHLNEIVISNYILLSHQNEIPTELVTTLKNQEKAINILSDLVSKLSQEEEYGEPEPIDLCDYFKGLEGEHYGNPFYTTHFVIDAQSIFNCGIIENLNEEDPHIYVNMARPDLDNIVENIKTNAERHGFTDSNRYDYEFRIILSAEEQRVTIDFCNNGNPFPSGMTQELYELKGEKGGRFGGTGIGGSFIKDTVKHYHGTLEVSGESSPVTIRISLPIYNKEEHE